ncbi:MAG: tetratricopeptide repeat protein [Myxococcota bacterium]|nr:tetratricopeptide repeat protein [Myxococcota bacterium]
MVTPARDREAIDQAIVRGSDQLKQGRLDLAQSSFREALALEPENVKVLALLGLTYFRGGQFAEARPIYEQLAALVPADASHRLNLGLVYLKIGDGDKAIGALEASRSLDPSQGRAVSYLGLAYARGGRYAEAYRSFLMAGQNELASEIEVNLSAGERDQIQAQLGKSPSTMETPRMTPAPRTIPPPPPGQSEEPRKTSAHTISRTASQQDGELAAKASAAMRAPPKPLGHGEVSSPEIIIEKADLRQPLKPLDMSESQQFVLPTHNQAAPVAPVPGHSMVSMAVATAHPTQTPTLTKAGGTPPRPLSELATEELVKPADSDETFEIAPGGALIMRVTDKLMARLEGVHVTGGDLSYEPATRRSRGHQTQERFDYGGTPLYAVSGDGYLVAVAGKKQFSAVLLDDDILYLREDLVFAFEGSLRWENGNVPGLRGKLPVVQFRGDGALVLRTQRPLVRVKLTTSGVVLVDADRIAGWIGRVIPRAVVPAVNGPLGAMCIECTGEGIVLVEPAPDNAAPAKIAEPPEPRAAEPVAATKSQPPPPPGSPVELESDPDDEDPKPKMDPELAGFSGDPEDAIDRLDEI